MTASSRFPTLSPDDVTHPATRPAREPVARAWALMVLGSLGLAALSLLTLPQGVGYDAWSWLVWGREILHLHLDTRGAATAVKPLPMFVDTGLALTGPAAPVLWLLVARAGALLALALAFRLGRLLGGVAAGLVAAGGLLLADTYAARLFFAGLADPMTAAAVLAAVDSHLRRRHGAALAFLAAAALLRPEVWPVLIGYGWWLARHGSWARQVAAVVAAGAVPAVWFALDWFGSGQLSRSAEAATHESQGGPLLSRVPGLATFTETWQLVSGQVLVLFLLGTVVALARGRRDRWAGPVLWLAVAAVGWVAVDAALAQARLATGAPRYLVPGVALACVVAGCFVGELLRLLRLRARGRGWGLVAGAAVALALVAAAVPRAADELAQVQQTWHGGTRVQQLQDTLPRAVATAGGRPAILRCGQVSTSGYQVPLLAWALDVPIHRVSGLQPDARGTVITAGRPQLTADARTRLHRLGPDARPSGRTWTVLTGCTGP